MGGGGRIQHEAQVGLVLLTSNPGSLMWPAGSLSVLERMLVF